MIAGFIFLRLRGILGKRSGFETKVKAGFEEQFIKKVAKKNIEKENLDTEEEKSFLDGAKIAYETIIIDFSDSDNKLTNSKLLLGKKIFNQFEVALKERISKGHFAEITFIGVNTALIKRSKQCRK